MGQYFQLKSDYKIRKMTSGYEGLSTFKTIMRRVTILLSGLMIMGRIFAQHVEEKSFEGSDTIRAEHIIFTVKAASEYLIDLLGRNNLWRPAGDTMKLSLTRLIHHYNESFDSVRDRLASFDFDSVKLRYSYILQNDTIPVRWFNDSTFIMDIFP